MGHGFVSNRRDDVTDADLDDACAFLCPKNIRSCLSQRQRIQSRPPSGATLHTAKEGFLYPEPFRWSLLKDLSI
ncbi:hypothetical protein PI124_g23019 [Phytophthora idaei]|nr:hypothetical protein PI124_g23019 [Phytophthora idaei]